MTYITNGAINQHAHDTIGNPNTDPTGIRKDGKLNLQENNDGELDTMDGHTDMDYVVQAFSVMAGNLDDVDAQRFGLNYACWPVLNFCKRTLLAKATEDAFLQEGYEAILSHYVPQMRDVIENLAIKHDTNKSKYHTGESFFNDSQSGVGKTDKKEQRKWLVSRDSYVRLLSTPKDGETLHDEDREERASMLKDKPNFPTNKYQGFLDGYIRSDGSYLFKAKKVKELEAELELRALTTESKTRLYKTASKYAEAVLRAPVAAARIAASVNIIDDEQALFEEKVKEARTTYEIFKSNFLKAPLGRGVPHAIRRDFFANLETYMANKVVQKSEAVRKLEDRNADPAIIAWGEKIVESYSAAHKKIEEKYQELDLRDEEGPECDPNLGLDADSIAAIETLKDV